MKTQNNYYQVIAVVNGIHKEVKRYQSVAWLRKYLLAHPNLLYYRCIVTK